MRAASGGRRGWISHSRRGIALLVVALLAGVAVLVGVAVADDGPAPAETPGHSDESAVPSQVSPDGKHEKLDGALALVADAARTAGDAEALAAAESSGLTVVGGSVRVLVEGAGPDLAGARAAIIGAGGTLETEYADTIQALLPPSGLDLVAASPDVRYIRMPAARAPNRAR